jgi:hypothetical protein
MSILDSRQVGQVKAIVTVIDDLQHDSKGTPVYYTGAFIELLYFKHNRQVYSIHGIVEVEDWLQILSQNPCDIGYCCFFDISTILQSTYIILTSNAGVYYINNYID